MGCYRKGNRWYIDYYNNGKRKREVVTIPDKDPATITLRDAEKALAIRKAEIAQGKFDIINTEKQVNFDVLMSDYLNWAKENHRSYIRDVTASKVLINFFRGVKISDITLWHIERYKSNRKKIGRKPETINRELTVLRRIFKLSEKGVLKQRISKNPIAGMQLLKIPKKKYRTLKHSEIEKLYQASSPHLKPIILLAYLTGMRKGEILKLKWVDVDLCDGYIHVNETKNDENRSIPIGSALTNILVELKKNSRTDYVFNNQDGKPFISIKSWSGAFNNAVRRSGIDKCTFHDLRHTFISNLIVGEKEDFATVMAISGHKDIRMLQRYSHTNQEAKMKAIEKIDSKLSLIDKDESKIKYQVE